MAITFTGLASGINTDQIISQLQSFAQTRINSLKSKEQEANNKGSVLNSVRSRLQTLQAEAAVLSRAQDSVFDRRAISSSDETIVKAAAGSAADPGVQSLRVRSLARAHQVASQGFDDPTSQITSGTFEIHAGSGASATITIDASNNTLAGLAKEINKSGIGVTASVINDGSDPRTQPYRLLLTSSNTGTDSAITITNNLAANVSGAVKPNFGTTQIGPAVVGANFSGTASVTANSGAGQYTGTANDTFTFTVQTGGTVGTDNGIQVAYSNNSGTKTGTLTINQPDAGVAKAVIDGVQVTLGVGTLTSGDQFSIDVFAPTIQAAQNAQIQLGSGDGAITVQSATNQVTNLIRGVTLSLQSADPDQEIKLTTTNDVDAAKTEITNFVEDYNDFVSFLTKQTAYDSATNTAGPLTGNRAVVELKEIVQRTLLSTSADLPSASNRLSALGITLDDHGNLQVNQGRLSDALNERIVGVSFSDIKKLFTLRGQSTSAGITFVTGSGQTKNSSTPYDINISQPARQATLTAANSVSNSILIDGTNNELVVKLDGSDNTSITLASGTYTPLAFAQEVQARVNSAFSNRGSGLTVSLSGQTISLTSNRYGSASELTLVSGSALGELGFIGGETNLGQNVAGHFIVNGNIETATGLGQILTGQSTNANTADLAIQVTLTDSQVVPGVDGTLSVTHGLASQLNSALESMLDPLSGRLQNISSRFTKNADDARQETVRAQQQFDEQTTRLKQQFAAMEQTLNQVKTQGEFVTNALLPSSSTKNS